jgi:hypothetical protein
MSALDVLILIPLGPLFFIAITWWWLPWHRWIDLRELWDEVPKSFIALYVLYGAFAAWHFKLKWYWVAVLLLAGSVLSVLALAERARDRARSHR